MTVDTGRFAGQRLFMQRLQEFLLLGDYLGREIVASPAIGRIRLLVLRPYRLGESGSLVVEFLLGADDATNLADDILHPGLRLVPKQLWVVVWNVAVVARGADALCVDRVVALAIFGRDPLHRVACAAA